MGSALDSTIALVSATAMCQYLGVTMTTSGTSTEEIECDYINNAVGQFALKWTGRTALVLATSLTEYYPGGCGTVLETRALPISAVSSLQVDVGGTFSSSTTTVLTEGTDFQVDNKEGRVFLTGGYFLDGYGGCNSVKLIYSAGYSTVPWDLQQAAKELAQYWSSRGTDKRVGMQSQSAGDTTKSYESDVPKAVAAVFDRYKAKAWSVA